MGNFFTSSQILNKEVKKLSLNAAFKLVFGEALEPLGFKLVKSRYPYFVRIINGEILHIITIKTEQASYPEDKAFTILGGIATVYRPKIDFSVSISNNYNWLRADIGIFYLSTLDNDVYFISDEERMIHHSLARFNYFSKVPKSLPSVMSEALEGAKKYMLPQLDSINSLEKCIAYFEKKMLIDKNCFDSKHNYDSYDYDEGFLYLITDNAELKESWRQIVEHEKDVSDEVFKKINERYQFFINPILKEEVMAELNKRKSRNISTLKTLGIID